MTSWIAHTTRTLSLLLASTALMAGCNAGGTKVRPLDVTGHLPPLAFHLTDDNGKTVTEADFGGKPVVLYFGYSGCGDACPLTLARLSRLAAQSDFRALFVSVDPLDRPAGLHAWLSTFRPLDVHGLTGPDHEIADLARRCRAAYRLPAHSQAIYIFDGEGRARFLISPGDGDADFLHAIALADHD